MAHQHRDPTKEPEFGYKVKVRAARAKPRLIYFVCGRCGSDSVEQKFFCQWDTKAQKWETSDWCEDEAYCNDCQDETDLTERYYGS